MQASGTHSVHVTPALTKTYESHIAEAGNKQISRSVTFLSQQGVGKRTNQNQLQGHAEHRWQQEINKNEKGKGSLTHWKR